MFEVVQEWDKALFLLINGGHAPYWDQFMALFTSKEVWIPMYASILYVLIRNFGWRMVVFTTLAFVLVITVADQLSSSVLRPLFERPRPSHNPAFAEVIHLINGRRGGQFGFPSAHAANTAALTTFIILFFKRWRLSLFFVLWTLITCYTRSYVGVHYPGDLLFGLVVGIFSGGVVYLLYRGYYRIKQPEKIGHSYTIAYTGILTIIGIAIYSFR